MEEVSLKTPARDWSIFFASVFFVLGFSVVFSIVGILLQTTLAHSSRPVQEWLGRIGGVIIIFFGLFLLDLIKPPFLARDHKFAVKKFNSRYITAFVFGAAFAIGWTPCVSAALGAILALAATNQGSAFFLLFAYTLGVGVPFLLVGLFTTRAQTLINKAGPWLRLCQYIFGIILIAIGIFIFVGELSKIANFEFIAKLLISLNLTSSAGGSIKSLSIINITVAFLAGIGSFLSPCILPLIPGFLSYLASSLPTGPLRQSYSEASRQVQQ